jgi:hypothetical protein
MEKQKISYLLACGKTRRVQFLKVGIVRSKENTFMLLSNSKRIITGAKVSTSRKKK